MPELALTLFSLPKPFHGNIEVIQRNALQSWKLLYPACEIILFGDDEGTAEVAAELAVKHIPDVARNEWGTPLVNDLFGKAECQAAHELLCYVNADILLMSDFMPAVEQVRTQHTRFLMVGQRWNLDVTETLHFGADWEEDLRDSVAKNGELYTPEGIDYFVFRRGLWEEIPPFAIGRTIWDNWLIYGARLRKAAVIDATQVVTAIHQNHDYSHVPNGTAGAWKGPEAQGNLDMMEGYAKLFSLRNATWLLTPHGLRRAPGPGSLGRHMQAQLALHPKLHALQRTVRRRLSARWQALRSLVLRKRACL